MSNKKRRSGGWAATLKAHPPEKPGFPGAFSGILRWVTPTEVEMQIREAKAARELDISGLETVWRCSSLP